VFRVAVLPRLRPAIAFSFLVTLLYVMADFGAVAVLDTPVLTWRLYQAVNQQQLARAALLGLSLLALALPLVVASRVLHGRDGGRRSVANPRPVARRPLGRVAGSVTAAAHLFVIGFGVVVPLVTLVGWVRGGVAAGRTFAPLGEPLLHSAMAAAAGAVVTVALAVPVAWAVARAATPAAMARASRRVRSGALSSGAPSAWRGAGPRGRSALWRRLEDGVYLTSALPGVLLAFGLLLAALMASRAAARSGLAASSGAVYQALLGTGALLIVGYGARFLAEAYAPLRNAVGALDPRWQETARTLGASARRRFTALTVPALAPGTSVAFVLVVLAIVKELPVTLLLGGAMGLRPLAFRIYDRYQEAFLHDAGAAGLLLMVVSLATLAATLRWRRHV
jgi:iron(III) transport system permease protein